LERGSYGPFQLTTGPISFTSWTPALDGKKIFADGFQGRGELVRYDPKASQFVPFLSGVSAGELDFSRDGKWVTYAEYPEGIIWCSRTDGSERLQLTDASSYAGLPRWSPDRSKVAYVSIRPGLPWKMFLVSAQGGSPEEILPTDQEETDPSWSPDGKKIAFGRDPALHTGIHIVDLATHRVTAVPESQDFFSPRWSPEGRYLAALTRDSAKLMRYDLETQKWTEWIHEPGAVGFPNWSKDGKYVYYHTSFSQQTTFRKVKVGETRSELVLDLQALRRYTGPPAYGWSGLTPDGSALFTRDLSTDEIYALDLDLR